MHCFRVSAFSQVTQSAVDVLHKVVSVCTELPTSGKVEPSGEPVRTTRSVAVHQSTAVYARSIFSSALARAIEQMTDRW